MLLCHMMILLRVTVSCAKGNVLELRGDTVRMFGYLNNTTVKASDKKDFTLALPGIGNQYLLQISSRVNIMVMLLFMFFVLLQ